MEFVFKPWEDFKQSIAQADGAEIPCPIPLTEPPCRHCKFWSPRAITDSQGNYDGVRLCMAKDMSFDFSCFKSRD